MFACRRLLGLTAVGAPTHVRFNHSNNSTESTRDTDKTAASVGDPSKVVSSDSAQKLNLSLRLTDADFGAMVKATKAAMAKERLWRDLTVGSEVDISSESGPNVAIIPKHTVLPKPLGDRSSCFTTVAAEPQGARVDLSGDTRDNVLGNDNPMSSTVTSAVQDRTLTPGVRYGLMDTLRDCLISGDWPKSMRMFESAIQTACNNGKGADTSFTAMRSSDSVINNEMLEGLHRFNATTPVGSFAMNLERYRGILRWSGGHYYLLMKLLLSRHRIEEVERVWDVMKRIGYVEYRMNERTCNQLIALCRTDTKQDIVSPLLHPTKETHNREKEFRTSLVLELENWAEKKHVTLSGRNETTARVARVAHMLRSEGSKDGKDEAVGSIGHGLRVGDFSGLLRRCNSEESTARVLQMMEKLNVPRDGQIYSALIAALRQPHYQLCGSEENLSQSDGTKEAYDAHRKRRLKRARQWYDECPEESRTIDVCNEMLLITRGGSAEDVDYANLLTDIRGTPLTILGSDDTGSDTIAFSKNEGRSRPQIPVPRWKIPPNGRTYEVMVLHCRHHEEWPVVWALYDEMMERNVKGTQRLYQMLLEIVQRHPPCGRDRNTVVLELYEDMKRFGLDVTDIKSTASVVNSWCATRRKRRW
ncbi:hypothetical protein, conserved [Trypanosoma brucei gambiense DAL972]|uniref:Kinetoplast polyadenylation/uridylation factor 2 n=1 Tax=Trypanosoma brucei gambiense (strain MHOM/CI/86/DAL972) TaxID=679716 RepID=D0A9Z2_TRYB9|nr:hypothetical protein, conserved [Trypanosoma brucei gambiense DAL972]CBH18493.1 hypothetical protein, conserved [Trypanosoma brucei gambiense DAL972]|eukprot:XP_011780757.1 hypothetical protein, conserved [Trypanosoma brucei gambiense DAL972]